MSVSPGTIQNQSSTPIRFNFHSIRFTPYNNQNNLTSTGILIKAITFLHQERGANRAHVIDRNKNRPDDENRELFMYGSVIIPKTKRIRCSIALLRGGKMPMVKPKGEFNLLPFDQAQGSIAELTHFFIDYSNEKYATLCVEYNHNGPRFSDIEYYFRDITSKKLSLSKATSVSTFMDNTIDETLANLHNVLNFEIKLKPENITNMDNDIKGYITDFATIGQRLKPQYIKIEAMFQTPGAKVKSKELNKGANTMITSFLEKFQKRPFHIEQFEGFEVKYETKTGEDEFFNLLKGKKEVVIEIDRNVHLKLSEWYDLLKLDFDLFIQDLK